MQLTKEQLTHIRDNQSECPRGIAKHLGVKLSTVRAWIKFYSPKPRKLINKSKQKKKPSSSKTRERSRRVQYKHARLEHLDTVMQCEVCGNPNHLSIHHIAGRAGELLCDRANFLVVCMVGSTFLNEKYPESSKTEGCHPWIERNLKMSREIGYSKSKIKQ